MTAAADYMHHIQQLKGRTFERKSAPKYDHQCKRFTWRKNTSALLVGPTSMRNIHARAAEREVPSKSLSGVLEVHAVDWLPITARACSCGILAHVGNTFKRSMNTRHKERDRNQARNEAPRMKLRGRFIRAHGFTGNGASS
jgi:hypothetical protein